MTALPRPTLTTTPHRRRDAVDGADREDPAPAAGPRRDRRTRPSARPPPRTSPTSDVAELGRELDAIRDASSPRAAPRTPPTSAA